MRNTLAAVLICSMLLCTAVPGVSASCSVTDAGTVTCITPGTQEYMELKPSVSGSWIVWADQRRGHWDIAAWNPVSGTELFLTPDLPGFDPDEPAVAGDAVVWTDFSLKRNRICLCSLADGTLSYPASGSGWQYAPAIDEGAIVWTDTRDGQEDIYLFDRATGVEQRLTADEDDQRGAAVDGPLVAWEDWSGTYADIVLLDRSTGSVTLLTPGTDDSDQKSPAISGSRVVWEDWRSGSADIMLWDAASNTTTLLTPGTDGSDQLAPAISGSRVVWEDKRGGSAAIMLYDIVSGTTTLLTPGTDGSDQKSPAISGSRVVWEDYEDPFNPDIMLMTLGAAGPCASAAFDADPVIGPAPLPVFFFDRSTGVPAWRHWDFGDGTGSEERDPVHIYAPGRYTVTLEVGTPVCRDRAVRTECIAAGVAPRADFSANRTEGYAPLPVAFADISTGTPGEWHWDFGDGAVSDSRDPVHTYTAGGSYAVSLTVANEFGSDTVLRPGFITAVAAVPGILRFATPGVAAFPGGRVAIDTAALADVAFDPAENRSVVAWKPDAGSGLARIRLVADAGGFSGENGTLSGVVVQTVADSRDLSAGAPLPVALRVVCPGWQPDGAVRVASWENATPLDTDDIYYILTQCDYTGFSSIAATMEVDPGGTPVAGMRVRMAADPGWAAREEDAGIAFIRLTGYGGEVLPARRIAANGTVWFEADAPGEASRFVLASLTGSGNPFQFVYRVIEQYVTDNPEKAGASLAGATGRDVPIEEIASEYAESMAIGSGLLSLDESGCTACPLSVWAEGGTCTLFVPAGTRATGCDCEPLQEITVMSIDTGDLPAVQEDAALPLGGVDLQPDGATFEPAVRLTFALPSCYATDFGMPAIRRWNATAMDWEPVATVVDAANGTATGTVDHFCIVGLFAGPYPTATPSPVPPAPTAAPAAPAVIVPTMRPTHLTITAGLVAWATDMAVRHPHVIAAAVVLAALLGARRIRR